MNAKYSAVVLFALGCLLNPVGACAEVKGVSKTGFVVQHRVNIDAPRERVYEMFLNVGAWWNPDHSYSGKANNLYIDARVQGCFCEWLPWGGGVVHMTVDFLEPDSRVRMVGGLGPLGDLPVAGTMIWEFEDAEPGSVLSVTYHVSGDELQKLDTLAAPVDGVIGQQVGRLKSLIETGSPVEE